MEHIERRSEKRAGFFERVDATQYQQPGNYIFYTQSILQGGNGLFVRYLVYVPLLLHNACYKVCAMLPGAAGRLRDRALLTHDP